MSDAQVFAALRRKREGPMNPKEIAATFDRFAEALEAFDPAGLDPSDRDGITELWLAANSVVQAMASYRDRVDELRRAAPGLRVVD